MIAEVGKTRKRRHVVINLCFTQRAIFLPRLHSWWEVTATICHKGCWIYHHMRCEGPSQRCNWHMVPGTDPSPSDWADWDGGIQSGSGSFVVTPMGSVSEKCGTAKLPNYRNNCFNAQIPELFAQKSMSFAMKRLFVWINKLLVFEMNVLLQLLPHRSLAQ